MFVRSLFDPCRIWKLFSRHENWWHGFLTFARGNTHILPDWGLRWTPGNKARKLPWKIAGALGNPTLTQRDIFRQGSRRAHLPRRECSYGSFRGNPGFGRVKVSHDVSCFHYITTCPTTSPSPLCTHLFAHTFVCTYYIILMILFVYYCCFIDINIYIYTYTDGERYTHTFVSVSWLPSTEHPDLSYFSQAFTHDSSGTISEHDAQRAPLDPMKSHGSHMIL